MSTFKDLLPLAAQVRDATEEGENTSKRVGDLFVDIIQEIESYVTDNDEDKRDTKNELIKRIQGTSEDSNAMRDPFKSLGIIDSIEEMLSLLDGLCSDVAGTNDYGKFRINLNGVNVYVTNYVLGRDNQVFAQEIYAPIEIRSVVGEEKSYLTADESAASYVHITRKYAQELKVVTNWRATGSSRTLRRTHHKDNGWSNWVDTSSPYIASPLYGKNILLLGGSFAHNMRAFAGGLGFTIDKKDYSMQNYIAEQLGLSHFDNFAIQGEGCCTTEGVFLKRNTLEQFRLAAQKATENGYSYDAIILVGGLNDFQKSVPVGKLSDATTAGTFCAGLKALANDIRATYSTAKILFTTPFRCTNSTDWGDAFWNPLSTRINDAGCRFAEYIQAIKEVAHLRSIPLLDIYSICQIDTHNAGGLLLSDLVHPNGQGYLTVAPALLDFIAWQKGAAGFNNDALQMNLKQELGEQVETLNNAITAETLRAEKAETFLTPVPKTYWRLFDVGSKSTLQTNSRYESIIIPVREGDRFIVTAEGDGYARTWGVLSEDKYVLRYSDVYPLTNAEVIIAAGEHYLVVNSIVSKSWDVRTTNTVADILQQFVIAEDRATERALRNLFVAEGALYNDTAAPITRTAPWGESVQHLPGYYYLNGLGDITEEQMMAIYIERKNLLYAYAYAYAMSSASNCRTLITNRVGQTNMSMAISLVYLFGGRKDVEVIGDSTTPAIYLSSGASLAIAWSGCTNLKHISSKNIYVQGANLDNTFKGCASLETVYLRRISTRVSFSDSPNLSKNSLLYMIGESRATSAITITLHADAYARLENDAEIIAALESQPLVTLVSA